MVFYEDVTEEYIKKDKVWDFMVNVDSSKEAASYYDTLLSAIGDNEGRWGITAMMMVMLFVLIMVRAGILPSQIQ